MVGRGWPLVPEILGQTDLFQSIFVCSTSGITPSEKNFNFHYNIRAYNEPKINSPQKLGSKTQNGRFRLKLHFTSKQSATDKVLCVNSVSDKVWLKIDRL